MTTAGISQIMRTIPLHIAVCLLLTGCLEFKSIDQPSSVLPDETFTVFIETTISYPNPGGDVMAEDSQGKTRLQVAENQKHGEINISSFDQANAAANNYSPYFGILLPQDWAIPGDVIACSGNYNQEITFDPNLAIEQEALSPSPEGYYWWVGDGNAADVNDGSVYGEILIQTSNQMGLFSIDYMLGNSYYGLNHQRSNNHLIEVVDEYTPRELQAVVEADTVMLSWSIPSVSEGLIGYNVYRDGQLINIDLVEDTNYIDTNLTSGVFYYVASAIYGNGDEHFTPYEIKTLVFSGGTGEPNTPFQITMAEQLVSIADFPDLLDKSFVLINDIDLDPNLQGAEFFEQALIPVFYGIFDGNGHTISHLTINGKDDLGFFGRLESGAEVRNLGVVDVNIIGSGDYAGGLVGFNNGSVTHCYSTGVIIGNKAVGGLIGSNNGNINTSYSTGHVNGSENVGGLVGLNSGSVTNCYSNGNIAGNNSIGGIVGLLNSGQVTQCYSMGFVSGIDDVGGLVGLNNGAVTCCYSACNVIGNNSVGGLVGTLKIGRVSQCYSTGSVSGTDDVGGLVGSGNTNRVTVAFWDMQTSGQSTSAGGTGKKTTEMKILRTYLEWIACSNDILWTIDEGNDYPKLWWENKPGRPMEAWLSDFLEGEGTDDNPYIISTLEDINIAAIFPCEQDKYFKLKFCEGEGTQESPYMIYSADEINLLTVCPYELDKHFKLMADIDLNPNISGRKVFDNAVIAPGSLGTWGKFIGTPFTGVFDGNGHAISNLTIDGGSYLGLFGNLESGAEVKNLSVLDINITGSGDYVGGLVGRNSGHVTNCYSTGVVSGGGSWFGGIGGLVGYNSGSIAMSYSTSMVSGTSFVGGLVGNNYTGSIANCYSRGRVSGRVEAIGGLVGYTFEGSITTSYSTGAVSGIHTVGGLVGYIWKNASIASSFWDTQTSGQLTSDGGIGKTTAEMQTDGTFLQAGWDFAGETENGTEDIWWILEGQGYPRLCWELIEE